MKYTKEKLEQIYHRTDGNCHICGGGLTFNNHGKKGEDGAWEVEHSKPLSKGGTDHGNNLYAAHFTCNRSKGTNSTRSERSKHGKTRAPRSKKDKDKSRGRNILVTSVGSAIWGFRLGGPAGAAVFAVGGAIVGVIFPVSKY